MNSTAKRMSLVLGWAISTQMGLTTASAQQPTNYQAICQKSGCTWVGPARGADLRQAVADAYEHGSQTGHFVWVHGLHRHLPFANRAGRLAADAGEQPGPITTVANERYRARCVGKSWAGPVECSWVGAVHHDISAALSDLVHHQSMAEHIATIEHLPTRRGVVEDEDSFR
jgi:hypothetical protein